MRLTGRTLTLLQHMACAGDACCLAESDTPRVEWLRDNKLIKRVGGGWTTTVLGNAVYACTILPKRRRDAVRFLRDHPGWQLETVLPGVGDSTFETLYACGLITTARIRGDYRSRLTAYGRRVAKALALTERLEAGE